jgi:hypothetical protein
VVVLRQLVVLVDVGVGMGVVTAGGDRVMVVAEGRERALSLMVVVTATLKEQ